MSRARAIVLFSMLLVVSLQLFVGCVSEKGENLEVKQPAAAPTNDTAATSVGNDLSSDPIAVLPEKVRSLFVGHFDSRLDRIKAAEKLGEEILPDLYNILNGDSLKELWSDTILLIGSAGNSESVSVLQRFFFSRMCLDDEFPSYEILDVSSAFSLIARKGDKSAMVALANWADPSFWVNNEVFRECIESTRYARVIHNLVTSAVVHLGGIGSDEAALIIEKARALHFDKDNPEDFEMAAVQALDYNRHVQKYGDEFFDNEKEILLKEAADFLKRYDTTKELWLHSEELGVLALYKLNEIENARGLHLAKKKLLIYGFSNTILGRLLIVNAIYAAHDQDTPEYHEVVDTAFFALGYLAQCGDEEAFHELAALAKMEYQKCSRIWKTLAEQKNGEEILFQDTQRAIWALGVAGTEEAMAVLDDLHVQYMNRKEMTSEDKTVLQQIEKAIVTNRKVAQEGIENFLPSLDDNE